MAAWLCKEDVDAARDRLTTWWNGGDIGRPAMQIVGPRAKPVEDVPAMPTPPGWDCHYSTKDFAYRVNCGQRACLGASFWAEAIPAVSPDLAPNCLALYLGCKGVEQPGTVWCEPFIHDPARAKFELKKDNFYWDFTLRLSREFLKHGKGKYMVAFPDLIEGLDTLAAMRDTQTLLLDLVERPDWVHASLKTITRKYFEVYDTLYEMVKDERGGSHFWAWAPGRMTKLQCDFSAMISADMFKEFMVPVLTEMTERLDYCMYHWDGVCALQHHDHLLSIPRLSMIQWTPGASQPDPADRKWWRMHHKSLDAGKKVILMYGCTKEVILALKREFGPQFKNFLISGWVNTEAEAQELIAAASE